jgi:ribonucleoside-diphosphate reductase alpha chain
MNPLEARLDEAAPSNPAGTPADLPPERLSANARLVLAKRYLLKDREGNPIEEPEQMFWRVARAVAGVETRFGASAGEIDALAREFYELMAIGAFEPNSPTLMNAGRPLGQLSACFVLPVEDTLSNGECGIYDTLRAMALVHQSGGGTGFSFSRLRPAGDQVRSTTGVASGPISFMRLYDASTDVVKQGGTRRGANMGILRVDHPDIRDFITCKSDTSQVTNFNISVAITDAFMDAVARGGSYELCHPTTGEVAGREDAGEIFDLIVHNAWNTGEPGVFFIDRANQFNPVPRIGSYEATNPCGEQPLLPFDVCNLGSVNLGHFVSSAPAQGAEPREAIDWEGLRKAVHLSIRFLDDVIDANRYPLLQITELAQRIRRVGLGVMGWADMLVRLRVPYCSDAAVELAREVMGYVDEEAKRASEELAATRGVFPEWEGSIWGPDDKCARAADGSRIRPERRLRNCNLTTVAPTGTISIFAGCSSGIEPLFAVAFMRNQAGAQMPEVNEDFVRAAREQGWYSESLMQRVAEAGHSHFEEIPEETREVFVTAHDITPEWHVRMQSAFQDHVDSAISKTTNFPHEATEDDVRQIYELAFRLGCKGVTVYRDGSRPQQVLYTGKTGGEVAGVLEKSELEAELESARAEILELKGRLENDDREQAEVARRLADRRTRHRPSMLRGQTVKMNSPLGDLYVTINEDESGSPFEVFCTLGKAGGAAMADTEAIGRLISLALRSGIPITRVRNQLRGISCDRAVGIGPSKVLSAPDAIAQAIERYLEDRGSLQEELPFTSARGGELAGVEEPIVGGPGHSLLGNCPDCGSGQLAFEEGCLKCHICGYSECG